MDDSEFNQKDFYLAGDTCKLQAFGWTACGFVNGKFHVIGANHNKSHIVYDPAVETNKFETVHTFNERSESSSLPGLGYVLSKNQFYSLGGYMMELFVDGQMRYGDVIWMATRMRINGIRLT